jgi:hypothetical protein
VPEQGFGAFLHSTRQVPLGSRESGSAARAERVLGGEVAPQRIRDVMTFVPTTLVILLALWLVEAILFVVSYKLNKSS